MGLIVAPKHRAEGRSVAQHGSVAVHGVGISEYRHGHSIWSSHICTVLRDTGLRKAPQQTAVLLCLLCIDCWILFIWD